VSSAAVVTTGIVPASEAGVALDVGLDSNVPLGIDNSRGAESFLDSRDPDKHLDCFGILEEALAASEGSSSLDFLQRLDRLAVGTSSSSMKDIRDLKKLLLASNRDSFCCRQCMLPGAKQVRPREGI